MKKFLGIMPARKGSKRIPYKCLQLLGNRPLFDWTIEFMDELKSKMPKETKLDILLSTDCETIWNSCRDNDFIKVGLRDSTLATDTSRTADVLMYEITRMRELGYEMPDGIFLFQPTSPFRSLSDYYQAIDMFLENNKTSVGVYDLQYPPEWMLVEESGMLKPLFGVENFSQRSQELSKAMCLNGALYLFDPEYLMANGTLFTDELNWVQMYGKYNLDIDVFDDLKLAESYLSHGRH